MIGPLIGLAGKVKAAYDLINTRLTAARAGYLDNLSAGPVALASTAVSNADATAARLAKLDNLDVAVSTRLSSSVIKAIYSIRPGVSFLSTNIVSGTYPIGGTVNLAKSIIVLSYNGSRDDGGIEYRFCSIKFYSTTHIQIDAILYNTGSGTFNPGNIFIVEFN